MGNGVQLSLAVAREGCALGEVLMQQAIGVLVRAALPESMWVGNEDADCEPLGQPLVLGHLLASIVRQGLAQRGRHVPEFLDEALSGPRRIRPLHPGQDDQARRPLHQRPTVDLLRAPLRRSPSQ